MAVWTVRGPFRSYTLLLTYDRSSKSHFWDFMIPPKPTVVCRNETDPGGFKRASKNVHILKFSAPVVKNSATRWPLKIVYFSKNDNLKVIFKPNEAKCFVGLKNHFQVVIFWKIHELQRLSGGWVFNYWCWKFENVDIFWCPFEPSGVRFVPTHYCRFRRDHLIPKMWFTWPVISQQ